MSLNALSLLCSRYTDRRAYHLLRMHEWPGQYQPKALKARVTLRGSCTCPLMAWSLLLHLGRLFTQQHSPRITGSRPLGQGLGYRRKEELHLLLSQSQSSSDLASTLKVWPCAKGCSCISYMLTHKILPTSLQVDTITHTIITFISQMRKLKHRVVQ